MRYFVVSDTHGFYDKTLHALTEAGFFAPGETGKLILLGDLLDRGGQALQMQSFALSLLEQGRLIYIRGNHEDLMGRMLYDIEMGNTWELERGISYHIHNGTFSTALQLTSMSPSAALHYPMLFVRKMEATPFCRTLIPASVDFFETEHYVFVHGWIPCYSEGKNTAFRLYKRFFFNEDWRRASAEDWNNARWYNGMEFARKEELRPQGKTVVCGHYHASFGHSIYEKKGSEFGKDADHSPYYGKGIIAMDACTAVSGMVNCIVIED